MNDVKQKSIPGSQQKDELKSQRNRLEDIEDSLEEGLSELHHELRRVNDGLEREGGQSSVLQSKAKILRQNIKLSIKELKHVRQQKEQLTQQLEIK